jgi:hypothetical protein
MTEEKTPAEAKSINYILRENCGERLSVPPLYWVQRHLDLLDCNFVQDNSIVPSLLRPLPLPSPPPDDLSPPSGHSPPTGAFSSSSIHDPSSPGSAGLAVPQPPGPKDPGDDSSRPSSLIRASKLLATSDHPGFRQLGILRLFDHDGSPLTGSRSAFPSVYAQPTMLHLANGCDSTQGLSSVLLRLTHC